MTGELLAALIDVETTGLSTERDEIIELSIGWVRVDSMSGMPRAGVTS
jgi:oligoribonuclease (3'-5' exoribonuclease)